MSISTTKTHPLTGLPLPPVGYRKNGSPIWPIMGGSEEAGKPEVPKEVDPAEGAKPEAAEELGDAGKKAIDEERKARKAAEKQANELKSKLQELEDAGKSEAEKQADELARAKRELAETKAERERLAVANATGIPAELLAGPGEDLESFAERLKEWRGEPVTPPEPSAVVSTIGQHPNETHANIPLDAQIAAAEQAGNRDLVSLLKARKLAS